MGFHAKQAFEYQYRGVFTSPLEYNLTASHADLARLKQNQGLETYK